MFKVNKFATVLSTVISLVFVIGLIDAQAMPGFARRYRMSCQVCHAPFPKLKPFGDEFVANGFKLPEGEPASAAVDTGDDLLTLTRHFPIGMRLDIYGSYDNEEFPRDDLKTPFNLKLISGGPLSDNISYYFYFFFSERGEVAGIEDAYIYFNDLGGSGINLTVGQFAVSDPLLKSELRLTYESYVAFARKPENSSIDLKYDRGLIFDYSFDFGFDAVLLVVNGNGIGPAYSENKSLDKDDYKNLMLRLSQDLFDVARIGAFGYYGREENDDPDNPLYPHAGTGVIARQINTVIYAGIDASLYLGPVEINGVYLYRSDSNPYFNEPNEEEIGSHGVIAEAILIPDQDGRLAITALYNYFFSDYQPTPGNWPLDYESVTANVSYLLRRNIKAMAEYSYIMRDSSREDFEWRHRVTLGLVAGF